MKNIKDILLENNNEDTARYFEVVKSKLPELQTLFINKLEINKKDFDLIFLIVPQLSPSLSLCFPLPRAHTDCPYLFLKNF